MGSVTVLNLICDLQKYFSCGGCTVLSEKLVNHIVPYKTDLNKLDTSPISFKQYTCSSLCEFLTLDRTEKCANYYKFEEKHKSFQNFSIKIKTSPSRLKLLHQD